MARYCYTICEIHFIIFSRGTNPLHRHLGRNFSLIYCRHYLVPHFQEVNICVIWYQSNVKDGDGIPSITFRPAYEAYDVTLTYVWQNGLPFWRGSDSCLGGVRFILGYCCVAANITLLKTGTHEAVWKLKVEPDLSVYIWNVFEVICRDFMLRENSTGRLLFLFTKKSDAAGAQTRVQSNRQKLTSLQATGQTIYSASASGGTRNLTTAYCKISKTNPPSSEAEPQAHGMRYSQNQASPTRP